MDEKYLKTFGQTTTLTGEDFELSFVILEVLIRTHSMTVTTTNPFDLYLSATTVVRVSPAGDSRQETGAYWGMRVCSSVAHEYWAL